MDISSTRSHFFSHRPLSALSKTTIAGLLGVAVFGILIWFIIRAVPFFLIIIAIMFICAALIPTGIRWMPVVGSVVCSISLYFLLVPTPFAFAHFMYPKGTGSNPWLSFGMFVIVAGIVWCMITTTLLGISASIQNYRQREQQTTPRWFPFALTGMIGLFLGTLLLGAIVQPTNATATTGNATIGNTTATTSKTVATTDASGYAVVHMEMANFAQTTITVAKGQKLKLVNDGSYYHIISTGSWVNGQPVVSHQAGGPVVNNVNVTSTGTSVEIGPFTKAGTYHLLCTVHPGMTLTIIVQ